MEAKSPAAGWCLLPAPVLRLALLFGDRQAVSRAARVCKSWQNAPQGLEPLWRREFEREFGSDVDAELPEDNRPWKQRLQRQVAQERLLWQGGASLLFSVPDPPESERDMFFAVDPSNSALFVSALPDGRVPVFELPSGRLSSWLRCPRNRVKPFARGDGSRFYLCDDLQHETSLFVFDARLNQMARVEEPCVRDSGCLCSTPGPTQRATMWSPSLVECGWRRPRRATGAPLWRLSRG
jgi:hypothetical protein